MDEINIRHKKEEINHYIEPQTALFFFKMHFFFSLIGLYQMSLQYLHTAQCIWSSRVESTSSSSSLLPGLLRVTPGLSSNVLFASFRQIVVVFNLSVVSPSVTEM